jgi:TPR repeat protein
MNRTFKAAAALVLAVGFAGSVTAGPLEDAALAYRIGNYATALELVRPLAEQGNSRAQTRLGGMYANGLGVPQDYAAAVSWYRKAAEQGFTGAQFALGGMYLNGHGVPQDNVIALMWFKLAAANGS